jgi:DNA-binding transcriptional LysR family regulator
VCLLADYEPAPAPLHALFQPSRLASPKIRAFADYLVERWRGTDPFSTQVDAGR